MPTQHDEPTVVVRDRTTDDLIACADALCLVHAADGYPVEGVADPLRWLSPAGLLHAWVALHDNQVAGHVAVSEAAKNDDAAELLRQQEGPHAAPIAVLGRLFVHPDARGHNLGRSLVTTATRYAQRHGLRLVLDVMTKDTAAIHLYESLGWQHLGPAIHHYGDGQHEPSRCYLTPR